MSHHYAVYVTWGDVCGESPTRATWEEAEQDLQRHQRVCERQGGYSDRAIYGLDDEDYLRDEQGEYVWPSSGRSTGAVRGTR